MLEKTDPTSGAILPIIEHDMLKSWMKPQITSNLAFHRIRFNEYWLKGNSGRLPEQFKSVFQIARFSQMAAHDMRPDKESTILGPML